MNPDNSMHQNEEHPEHHLNFIEEQNQCCLCGSDMDFEYQTQHEQGRILQKSKCSLCGISPKDQEHTIH